MISSVVWTADTTYPCVEVPATCCYGVHGLTSSVIFDVDGYAICGRSMLGSSYVITLPMPHTQTQPCTLLVSLSQVIAFLNPTDGTLGVGTKHTTNCLMR